MSEEQLSQQSPQRLRDSYQKVVHVGGKLLQSANSVSGRVLPNMVMGPARQACLAAQPQATRVHELLQDVCLRADLYVVNKYVDECRNAGVIRTLGRVGRDLYNFSCGFVCGVIRGSLEEGRSLDASGRSSSVESMEEHIRQAKSQAEEQEARELMAVHKSGNLVDSLFYLPLAVAMKATGGSSVLADISGFRAIDLLDRPPEFQFGWTCGACTKNKVASTWMWCQNTVQCLLQGKTFTEIRLWAEKRGYSCRHRASAD